MELQAKKISQEDFQKLLQESENKVILFQDISTKSISCSRCNASADNSNEIKHKDCCPYVWGSGC